MSNYRAMTAQGRTVDASGDSPLVAMQAAAERCEAGDFPVTLYLTDHTGALLKPAWGGKRGLGGTYPEGESPADAERLFRRGGEPA